MIPTWKIMNTESIITNGLITKVTYTVLLKDNGLTVESQMGQIDVIGDITSPNYIPYEQLTEAVVLKWVTDTLGAVEVTRIETELVERVQRRIDARAAVTTKHGTPWAPTSL